MLNLTTPLTLTAAALLLAATPRVAEAHCQVPCGIYDDHNRVHQMREDLTTITRAMKKIATLAGKADAQSKNQLVRWVVTKEQHAEKIMRTVADYFMAQKIKPAKDKRGKARYAEMLRRHHAVLLGAMKCKQSTDLSDARALGKALDGIAGYWK